MHGRDPWWCRGRRAHPGTGVCTHHGPWESGVSRVTVSIARAGSYEAGEVRAALARLLAPWGGMRGLVSTGDRVLVKPNFLVPKAVHTAVTTHPELILALCEAALDAGAGSVVVGDSPGFGSGLWVARKTEFLEPARAIGVEVVDFATPVAVELKDSRRFKRFELERTALGVDKIVNVGKVKTHGQMFMTLAVKNLFGCVVGVRKAAWHLEAGKNAGLFADMLLDLHYYLKPCINILDGIVMMEGNGPGNGTPRDFGVLAASTDAVALDRAVCSALSLPLERMTTHIEAERLGYGVPDPGQVDWAGVPLADVTIPGIVHPLLGDVGDFYVPGFLRRFSRRLLEVRPVVDPAVCTACGRCVGLCPAKAIGMVPWRGKERALIDPVNCIHCYCCQETCPDGAIRPRRGLVRGLLKKPGGIDDA